MFFNQIIKNIQDKTSHPLLFHSGTGKDSIMLADVLSKSFEKVTCVFMYLVKGLEYEERYIAWAEKKYPNVNFIKTPHYALYSFIKHGYLGIKKDPSQALSSIKKIDAKIRAKTGCEYSVYGFKKNDGITRRMMLNDCPNGYNEKTQKVYPLMDMKNSDVIHYIADNNLITPFNYGTTKPSSGCDISTPEFLAYMKLKYPNDLKKIFEQFPLVETILFKHEIYGKNKTV